MVSAVRFRARGQHACFPRPEIARERVSYDVMTPLAAAGILDAIHWQPALRWTVDRIHVLNPIRFGFISQPGNVVATFGVDEPLADDDRRRRDATILLDVDYVVDAHFDLTDRATPDDTEAKHRSIFDRRLKRGQFYRPPYLGERDFPADIVAVDPDLELPPQGDALVGPDRDLGWMLYDIDFAGSRTARFFRAHLRNGTIEIPDSGSWALAD